jgi:hypothetical protein
MGVGGSLHAHVNAKGVGVLQQIIPRHDREAGVLTLAFPDSTTGSLATPCVRRSA